MTATTLNNLGVFLKGEDRLYEALGSYQEALEIRRTLLGDKHSETIVCMYNMSELYLVMGSESKSPCVHLPRDLLYRAERPISHALKRSSSIPRRHRCCH